jgi:tetratricopeptide (TPR) repeat protein
LLIILVLTPTLLVALGGGAYVLRQQQVKMKLRRALDEGTKAYEARDYKTAMPLLATYVGRHRTADSLIMLADCRAHVPKPEGTELLDAARYAEAALAIDPRNQRAMEMLVGYYSRVGFITELNRVCDQLLALEPDHHAALKSKCQALMALGKYDSDADGKPGARAIAERLAAASPDDADPFRILLQIDKLQGVTDDAIAARALALAEKFPESFDLGVIYGQTLTGATRLADAASELQRSSKLRPATPRSLADFLRLTDLVSVRIRTSRAEIPGTNLQALRDSALAAIEKAVASTSFAGEAAAIAAAWEWRSGRLDAAAAWVERGLAAAPRSPGVLSWKAILTRDKGQPWTELAAPVREASGESALLWATFLDGLSHVDRAEWKEAAASLAWAMTKSEQVLSAPTSEGEAGTDDVRAAATEVSVLSTYFLGVARSSLGDWRPAVRSWLVLADAEQGWTLPLLNASQVLRERGQLDSASRCAGRALQTRPGPVEAMAVVRAVVARAESGTATPEDIAAVIPMATELRNSEPFASDATMMLARLAIAAKDQPRVTSLVTSLLAITPPPPADAKIELARRIRAADLDGWRPLIDPAQTGSQMVIFRSEDAAKDGRTDEALAIVRDAASTATTPGETRALRLREVQILASAGSDDQAREALKTYSAQNVSSAGAQLDVLDQRVSWSDAVLVETAVARLRAATGDAGIEWQLADATRLLTFSPDPAKAQDVVVRLTRISRDDPSNAQALALLGEWMLILGDQPNAIDNLARAVDISDAPPSLYPRLIGLLRKAGRANDAHARLIQFSSLRNISPALRRTRARLLKEDGLTELAKADLEVLAADAKPADLVSLAAAMLDERDIDGAKSVLDRVLATPSLPRASFLAAIELLIEAGDADRALGLLDQRTDQPTPARGSLDRARLLERAGRTPAAEAAFVNAVEQAAAEDASPAVELTRFYMRSNNPKRARDVIAQAKARGIKSPELDGLDALASVASEATLTDAQKQAVIESLPAGPERDLAEATRWFDAHPTETAEFISKLRKITTADPRLLQASQFLVQTLLQTGDANGAATAATAAATALPRSDAAARLETSTLAQAGRLADARAAAGRWRELSKDSTETDLMLAQIELSDGHPETARTILEPLGARALNGTPDTRLLVPLVSLYARLGDIGRAQQLAARGPTGDDAWVQAMARIAGGEAQPAPAAREWLKSFSAPLHATAAGQVALANAYASLGIRSKDDGDLRSALALLQPRLASQEAAVGEMMLASSLMEMLKQDAECEPIYRRVIEKDPSHWVAMNNLAYLLLQRDPMPSEAVSLARRASELAEKSTAAATARSSTLQTLALALVRSGQAAEALPVIRKALTLDATSTEARLTEVEALEGAGDSKRAKATLESILRQVESGTLKLSDKDRSRTEKLGNRLK